MTAPIPHHSITGYDLSADPSIPKPIREAGRYVTAAHMANGAGGIKDHALLVKAVSIAIAESDCDVTLWVDEPNGTKSFGPWMINSVHGIDGKTLTAQAPDRGGWAWQRSAVEMAKLSKGGTDFSPWTTDGALAEANTAAATQAVDRYVELVGGDAGIAAGGMTPEVKDRGIAVDEGIPGVPEAVDAVSGAAAATLGTAGRVLAVLADRNLWIRVGIGAAGVALVGAGLVVMFRRTQSAQLK